MKNLLMIMLLGCFILITNNAHSNAIPCDVNGPLQDCFNPDLYVPPIKLINSFSPVVKSKAFNSFTCSGTYTVAVYLHGGQIPTKFMVTSTCPTPLQLDDIVIWDGEAIWNILPDASSPTWASLLLEEIRDGGNPVIFDITFHDPGETGGMVVDVFSDAWNSTDDPPNPDTPIPEIDNSVVSRGYLFDLDKAFQPDGTPIDDKLPKLIYTMTITNNSYNIDSTGTTLTIELPSVGFNFTKIRTINDRYYCTEFQYTKIGNKIIVNMGTMPRSTENIIEVVGEVTRNCSTDVLSVNVTSNENDTNPDNNSYVDKKLESIKDFMMDSYPRFCRSVNLAPLYLLREK